MNTTKQVKIECVNVNTHDLVDGDEIMSYGVVFKIHNRVVHPMRSGDCPVKQGACITFDTELVWHPDFNKAEADESYYSFPLSWAKNYSVQGNKMAGWAKIVSREEF